jgi:hypothetical protein
MNEISCYLKLFFFLQELIKVLIQLLNFALVSAIALPPSTAPG